ncbi:MAG: SRPBCC domain-containing protein [Alcanivorax sp.]|uniref:SRPBCC domain-containing protein n=1 Tax=Alcanivorax sp. TaxID=1872427 RepID=UPI0032D97F39
MIMSGNTARLHLVLRATPNLPGEMQVTITLKEVLCGTDLTITQEGVPEVIPVEFCYQGWQESLEMLAQLVTPEIPDEG